MKTSKKHSIDKMIEKREDNSDFDEMTAQLAGKIILDLHLDEEDDEESTYEDLKDMIRDHVVSWFENGDTSMVKNEP